MTDRRCTVCMVFKRDITLNFGTGDSECCACRSLRNAILYREQWLRGSMSILPFEYEVRSIVLRALAVTNERIQLAGKHLGLSKATMHRWINKWKREGTYYQLPDLPFSIDHVSRDLAERKKEWRKLKSEAAKIRRKERRDAKIIKLADKAIASEQRKRARREASRLKGKKHVADSSSSLT